MAAMRTKDLDRVIESVRLRAMWSGLIVGVTIGGSVVALVMGMGI